MDYRSISNFFDKARKILSDKEKDKDLVKIILDKNIKQIIPRDKFTFKNGYIVFSNISPILRSELFMKKQSIIKDAESVGVKILDLK